MRRYPWLLVITLIWVNWLDHALTEIALQAGAIEVNPIMAAVYAAEMGWLKLIWVPVWAAILGRYQWARLGLYSVLVFYVVVVTHNVLELHWHLR